MSRFASFVTVVSLRLLWYNRIRVTCVTPTHPRKKLTAASLIECPISYGPICRPQQRVNSQKILRFDDEAPTSPYRAGACEGHVLSEGEVFSGAPEITDTREDKCPLEASQHTQLLSPLSASKIPSSPVPCWRC